MDQQSIALKLRGVVHKAGDHRVKGFLSVNALDFEDDTAAPEAFDLPSFLNRGTLLYNHQLWVDESGNPIPIGKLTEAHVVKLVESDDKLWGIKDIKSGQVIDTFPKKEVPNLSVGDRGVFVYADVEVEEVWRRVLRRMLSGFSWEGMATLVKVKVGDVWRKLMSNISMYEASLVFSPQQPDSVMLPVMKAAVVANEKKVEKKKITPDMIHKELVIFCLVFSPSKFDLKSAAMWLKKHDFFYEGNPILSEDKELIFPQISDEMINADTARSMQVEQGVQAIVGETVEGEVTEDERKELLRVTSQLLGCELSEVESEEKETNMKRKDELKAVLQKSTTSVGEEPVKVDISPPKDSAVVPPVDLKAQLTVEQPKEAVVVEPTVAAVTPVTETPPKETVQPIAPASVEVSAVVPVAEPVKPMAAAPVESRRPENEALEKALTNSGVIQKIGAVLSQNLMSVVGQKFEEVVGGLQATLEQFRQAAQQLASIIKAQSEAVAAMPALATKSAVTEIVSDTTNEVTELKKTVAALTQTVATMSKTAVSERVSKEEGGLRPEKDKKSPGDFILGHRFLGMKQ